MARREPKIAIIGAGLSGITLAIELRKRLGIESFTIYEKASSEGGTWRDNYYPGCACDVPSHWYSLSTELNPEWSQVYSSQPEIQRYWQGIYARHKLVEKTVFNSTFLEGVWDEDIQGYHVHFRRADGSEFKIVCDVLVSAIGGFSTPLDKPHGMKGLSDFEGEVFHSARWNYDVDLRNKKVGVIGNGCSAAQFVPKISEDKSTQVLNFSRTPSWFVPRDNPHYSSFTKWLFRHVPGYMRLHRWKIATESDVRFAAWMLQFSAIRHYAEEWASDYIKKTAPEKYHNFLIPKYPFGCKRIIMDPGYLECLHQSNVELIIDPIDTICKEGIRGKSGEVYDFDVLILGTGFDVSEVGLGINVKGRKGETVTEQWAKQKGPQAYLGTAISAFPNFYTLLGPNVATGHASVIYSTESQTNYIVNMIEKMVTTGVTSWEVKVDAETKYNNSLRKKLNNTVWQGGCTSYYKLGEKVIVTYPGSLTEFWWKTRKPVWEDYIQFGGNQRVAFTHRRNQVFKAIVTFVLLILVKRRFGNLKGLRDELLSRAILNYMQVRGAVKRLRA